MAMVEDVFVSVFRLEDFAAMSGPVEMVAFIAMKYRCGKAFLHGTAFSVEEVVGQLLCATHLQLISVVSEKA